INGTTVMENAVDSLGGFAVRGGSLQVQSDVDPSDHEHAFLFLHLTDSLRCQPVACRGDLAHLQCASKGSRESTGCGGHDAVERRRVRLERARRNLVILLAT